MNEPIKFTYQTTPELVAEQVLMFLQMRRQLSSMRCFAGFLIFISVLTWGFVLTGHTFRDTGVIPKFIVPLAAFIVLSGCTRWGLRFWMARVGARGEGLVGKRVVGELGDYGLRLDFQGGTSFTSTWEQFTEISERPVGLLMFSKLPSVFLLPREGFATPAEFEAAVSLARRSVRKA